MTTKPGLSPELSVETFRDHYWLKSELEAFCRSQGLSAYGGKRLLEARIDALLRGAEQPQEPQPQPRSGSMPSVMTRDTVIRDGWRCSQALRGFIESEIGRKVQFNAHLRALVHDGAGRTLGAVLEDWLAARGGAGPGGIAPQFEYNRFVRALHLAAPGAGHAAVVAEWRHFRDTPVSLRPTVEAVAERFAGKATA